METEAHIKNKIFLSFGGRPGIRLFRNSMGLATKENGERIKFGLCNPGGSDLIGWTEKKITPDMIGKTVAIFTAIEVKGPRGMATPAQKNFIDNVLAAGGLAGEARGLWDVWKILKMKGAKNV